jgi:hypothetical protein
MKAPLRRFAVRHFRNLTFGISLVLFLTSCSTYPVDTTGRDLPELESVWQYLKAYCIWQDSIPLPQNAFTYNTPGQILASVNDTFHGVPYTGYDSSGGAAALGNTTLLAGQSATKRNTIIVDSITPKTVYLQIDSIFEKETYDSFLAIVPVLDRFSKIMLDVRWNGGGDIAAMDSIIAFFLPVNTPYIFATLREYDRQSRTASTVRHQPWTTATAHANSLAAKNIVILMNRGSASASEMLAAGIKDGRKTAGLSAALIVGDTSYGKGIGQIVINRRAYGKKDIKITFLKVTRACGGCADSVYHRKGIAPDIISRNQRPQVEDTLQFFTAFNVLEPGVRPGRYITHFAKKSLTKDAAVIISAIPEMEK